MNSSEDRRLGGFVLFLLGGLAGAFFAARMARRRPGQGTIEGLQAVLDETVDGVESAAAYVRTLVEPVHELLSEATSLAAGARRAVDAYRHGVEEDVPPARYVPSMAPDRGTMMPS